MPTVEQMRVDILTPYPNSRTWPKKVQNMPDDQVRAVWHTFVEKGYFTGRRRAVTKQPAPREHQMTIWEMEEYNG